MKLKFLSIFALLIALIGCSSGTSPIEPIKPSSEPVTVIESLPVGIADSTSGSGALGIFDVHIDARTLTGEMVPVRTAQSSDVLEIVDITKFMTYAPCNDCVNMKSIALDYAGNLILSIGIKHPFPAADATLPASKSNRADLHVFNVEGTIFGDSGSSFSFPSTGEVVDSFLLLNADGYSKYLDPIIDPTYPTAATIHPYILHFNDYSSGNFDPANTMGFASVTDPPPSGNLVMPMGSSYDYKNYKFSYPAGGTLNFKYVVGCSFGISTDSISNSLNPVYRVPQFNKKAASELSAKISSWNYIAGDTASTVTIKVTPVDVNQGVAVGTALDQMAHDSSIARIVIEVPGFLSTPIDIANPTTNEFVLTNTAGGSLVSYPALVKVIDSYPVGANESPLLTGKDGLGQVPAGAESTFDSLFAISEFATYYAFILREPGAAPACVISTTPTDLNIEQGTKIDFDATDSTDDGDIITYEWDFEYDGSNFTIEAEGATVSWYICEPGTHTVALRLSDNDYNESICTAVVTVTANTGPIGGWGTDRLITPSTLTWEPYILNTSNRAIESYGDDLYVVMNSNIPTNKSENIYFMYSHDLGLTWSEPVKITHYPDTDNAWTREANLAVDNSSGDIYISYQGDWESFHASTKYRFDVFAMRITENLTSISDPVRVNSQVLGASNQNAGSIAVDSAVTPVKIYVAYEARAVSTDFDINVVTASANAFGTWTEVKIDDTAKASQHPSIFVNPTDHSVNVAWVDPKNNSGAGRVLFDRSSDSGATWGTDIIVRASTVTTGPYETCLAINPVNGIPAVMWREVSTESNNCKHYFSIAESAQGAVWNDQVNLSGTTTKFCWSGTLDVSSSGRWVAVFEKDTQQASDWKAVFVESTDDGVTWTEPVQVDDANWVFGLSMALDDCGIAHVVWGDIRTDQKTNDLYTDSGF
jgi:hypothetical protein